MKTEVFSASIDAGTNFPSNTNDVCAQSGGRSGNAQWSSDSRRSGRPRGELRAMLDSWSHQNPEFTMGQAARSLGWPISTANDTLKRAVAAGEVRVINSMRTPEAKRPVAVYARADYASGAMPLANLVSLWR